MVIPTKFLLPLYWGSLPEKYEGKRFYHISTDEVYGALSMTHPIVHQQYPQPQTAAGVWQG